MKLVLTGLLLVIGFVPDSCSVPEKVPQRCYNFDGKTVANFVGYGKHEKFYGSQSRTFSDFKPCVTWCKGLHHSDERFNAVDYFSYGYCRCKWVADDWWKDFHPDNSIISYRFYEFNENPCQSIVTTTALTTMVTTTPVPEKVPQRCYSFDGKTVANFVGYGRHKAYGSKYKIFSDFKPCVTWCKGWHHSDGRFNAVDYYSYGYCRCKMVGDDWWKDFHPDNSIISYRFYEFNENPCPTSSNCGRQHITDRVVGGKGSVAGEWPWQVGLFRNRYDNAPFCGGTLITSNVVLSAAHCHPSQRTYVRVGDTNLKYREGQEEMVGIQKVIVPSNYNSASKENDIAIIFLNKHVSLKREVFPACLPTKAETYSSCYVTGWGRLRYGGRQPTVLQKARVPIVSNSVCKAAYVKVFGKNVILPGMICAGYQQGGVDTCQGDSGGPLVCMKNGRWDLVGITSWGAGCAQPDKYGVYTNTLLYLNYIRKYVSV